MAALEVNCLMLARPTKLLNRMVLSFTWAKNTPRVALNILQNEYDLSKNSASCRANTRARKLPILSQVYGWGTILDTS